MFSHREAISYQTGIVPIAAVLPVGGRPSQFLIPQGSTNPSSDIMVALIISGIWLVKEMGRI